MSLEPCRECGTQISTQATNCPKCGAPLARITPKKKSHVFWWIAAIFVGVILVVGNSHEDKKPAPPLDFTKPIYTGPSADICPISIFYDYREGHDVVAAADAFTSIFSRSEKFKKLGCEEWHEGIRLYAKKMDSPFGFIAVGLSPENLSMFTIDAELNN